MAIPTRNNYYFTIEEAAERLPSKPTPEWVLQQFYDPDPCDVNEYAGLYIIPSFKAEQNILVLRDGSTSPEELKGWFEVVGIEDCIEEGGFPIQNGEICFDGQSKYPFLRTSIPRNCLDSHAGEYTEYRVSQSLRIPLGGIYIRDDELEHFKGYYYPIERVALAIETQPIKKEQPEALKHKDKPRGLGKLFKDALQRFYKEKGKPPEELSLLIDMLKNHMAEKQKRIKNPYLEPLIEIGNSDKHYLYVKIPSGTKWFSKQQAQRNYKIQRDKAVYPR